MNIHPINSIYSNYKLQQKKPLTNDKQESAPNSYATAPFEIKAGFNDHLISFKARVDKGLERFYEENKDRMPITVSRYVEALEDKSRLTPMEAQKRAFYKLETAQTIEEIKKDYPAEESFTDLINPSESKAKRGILNSVKENEELLALSNQGVLKDKSNLTVYLVKKVFLEAKTIEEINKDLENDLDPDFKADFKFKNKDAQFVYGSTLGALGIKTPQFEYRQSLRYTVDGFADSVGEKISKGQREFWDAMPAEERTSRNKKSVEKFENWWNSHTKNEKLDMIADQQNTLELLKDYKRAERAEAKLQNAQKPAEKEEEEAKPTRPHSKTGSNKLGQDDLFKIWASNNLKIFEASLSEADKDTLHVKRMQRLTERWANMEPAERTDYISKMKSGSEPLRYTMIDAWNHSTDLIKDLSLHLKANQILKPSDMLFSTQEFSTFQSQVMTEFWDKNPDYGLTLGRNIQKSQEKINLAISRGTFEELKKEIMRDKNQRVKEIDKFKTAEILKTTKINDTDAPDYIKEFKIAYNNSVAFRMKNIPKEYMNDYFEVIEKDIPEPQILAWTKNLNGEQISYEEHALLQKLATDESSNGAKINRALEAACADTLYECTKRPEVYQMSNSDVKTALYKLDKGDNPIELGSLKTGRDFQLSVLKKRINPEKIASLYHQYKTEMPEEELDEIVETYFNAGEAKEELKEYLKLYGKSLLIAFSPNSVFSKEVKESFYKKIKTNMPESLAKQNLNSVFDSHRGLEKEAKLVKARLAYQNKFDFVPKIFMDSYFKEIAKQLRKSDSQVTLDEFIDLGCARRKEPQSSGKAVIFPKKELSTESKLKTLAMEQALADILYEATGNVDVYSMQFEELSDNIELFSLVKKVPSQTRNYVSASDSQTIPLTLKKKINTVMLEKRYKEYIQEMSEQLKENAANSKQTTLEDILFVLNPDEDMPDKDSAVTKRIKIFNLNFV